MIIAKNIILRLIEKEDLNKLAKWRNNPVVHNNFFSFSFIVKSNQELWYQELLKSKDKIMFIIDDKKTNQSVGTVGLDNIDFPSRADPALW